MVLLGWVRQTPHVHRTSKGDMISDLEICRTGVGPTPRPPACSAQVDSHRAPAASHGLGPRGSRGAGRRRVTTTRRTARARRPRAARSGDRDRFENFEGRNRFLALRLKLSSKPRRQSRSTTPVALSSAVTTVQPCCGVLGTVDLSRSEQKLGRQLQAAHLLSLGAVGFRTSLVSKLLVNICTELEQVREKRGPLMAKGPGFIECTR